MANLLKSFVDTTGLHGPAEIYYAKSSPGRLYWSVIFVAMITCGAVFIYIVIVSYLEAPITTLLSTVDVKSMMLPEVAICYAGAIDTVKLLDNGLSKQAVRTVRRQFVNGEPALDAWGEADKWFNVSKPEILNFVAKQNITGYDGLIEYASFGCNQLILEYRYPHFTNQSCNFLKTVPHYVYGTCYVLPAKKQIMPYATTTAWTILLKAPLEHDLVQDLNVVRSFAIEIAQKYDVAMSHSFNLPLNRSVAMALQQTKYSRLEHRQWPRTRTDRCIQPADKTHLNCAQYCDRESVIQASKCLPFGVGKADGDTKYKNYSICWPDEEHVHFINDDFNFGACYNSCLPLCTETTYEVLITYSDLGAEQIMTKFGLAGNTQGVIHLQIGYRELRYTHIEEQDTFGLDSCVSNIGGMFGLWLGGSVFTIIHLLTTLCGCYGRTRQKSVPSDADGRV